MTILYASDNKTRKKSTEQYLQSSASVGEIIFVADLCPKIGSNLWYSKALQFKDTWSAVFCP